MVQRRSLTSVGASIAALAAAVLLLETVLLRLLAVSQFYHFAFLVVSLALLGFGASGSLLSLVPRLQRLPLPRLLVAVGLSFAASVGLTYGMVNLLPFDSYSIAWDPRQVLLFAIYFLTLTVPFLVAGLGIGAALSSPELPSHRVYAANLLGSALGAVLGPVVLALAGVPGGLLASALAGLAVAWPGRRRPISLLLVAGSVAFAVLALVNSSGVGPLGIAISPYKGLAQALRYPGRDWRFGAWNATARVDVVANAGTRQLPGLSYTYPLLPPPQLGLAVDAADLQPITLTAPKAFAAASYLPEAVAFSLRPAAQVLVLDPGAGLGVLQALAGGAGRVTTVQDNPLLQRAVARTARDWDPFADPRVLLVNESSRAFVQRVDTLYDILFIPLVDPYQPVTSGAYSLAETYDLTVEAFVHALQRLEPDGILVVTRWLQTPPSEEIRLLATLVEALEDHGQRSPAQAVAAYRGVQTLTALVRPIGWTEQEVEAVRQFSQDRRYDLVWAPGMGPDEANRFNRLPEPVYYQAMQTLLLAEDRGAFYAANAFDVRPSTDDHPFFFHFFTWRQAPEVFVTLGRTWQPFGGSGYFLLLALLGLVLVLSILLIALPLLLVGRSVRVQAAGGGPSRWRVLFYFGLLGLAFLLVEIPLIQRWILWVGHPTYAFAAVVAILLVGSGAGSLSIRSGRLPHRMALGALVILALATPFLLNWLGQVALGWPLPVRIGVVALGLLPLAFMMGLPFPLGLAWIEERNAGMVPWAWAINGCASVVSGLLAAILALSYGFTVVLLLGAACYGCAWLVRYVGSSA